MKKIEFDLKKEVNENSSYLFLTAIGFSVPNLELIMLLSGLLSLVFLI